MIRPCFLGAGLATHLGTGVLGNLAGLKDPPRPSPLLTRHVDGRSETIPYRLLADFPVDSWRGRLTDVVDTVVAEALSEARLSPSEQRAMVLCVGSSSFDISVSEHLFREELAAGGPAVPLRSSSLANLAEHIRSRFDLAGEDFTFATACTASANGLWYAARLVASGAADHALVVGVELANDLTALGFLGLGLLARREMRPFDRGHDGLVLGEAASALVIGRGGEDRFHLLGGANLCDTNSMVAAQADGGTIARVIAEALAAGNVPASAIDAVKAHGTGKPANDEAEAAGMRRTFATLPPVCALKPHIGHTLGACGLTELVLFYRALEEGFLVATPGIGGDPSASPVTLNQSQRPMSRGRFVLNYFGFGGNNTSLVIARG
jgi:3-oxoacyl-[acyl-carrier-protein] synthase-1